MLFRVVSASQCAVRLVVAEHHCVCATACMQACLAHTQTHQPSLAKLQSKLLVVYDNGSIEPADRASH